MYYTFNLYTVNTTMYSINLFNNNLLYSKNNSYLIYFKLLSIKIVLL